MLRDDQELSSRGKRQVEQRRKRAREDDEHTCEGFKRGELEILVDILFDELEGLHTRLVYLLVFCSWLERKAVTVAAGF